jgi:hypothetical protein
LAAYRSETPTVPRHPSPASFEALRRAVATQGVELVVIDPTAFFRPGVTTNSDQGEWAKRRLGVVGRRVRRDGRSFWQWSNPALPHDAGRRR